MIYKKSQNKKQQRQHRLILQYKNSIIISSALLFLIVSIFSISIFILVKSNEISKNDVISLDFTSTPEIKKTIEIKIAQMVSPEIIYQKIDTPVLQKSSLPFKPEPTATNTPEPTATNTPEPTATNTPEPTATNTPEPQKLITLNQSYIPQTVEVTSVQKKVINQRAKIYAYGDAPGSELEIWETTKRILIDLGLWYPLQSVFNLILVILFVFIILRWLRA